LKKDSRSTSRTREIKNEDEASSDNNDKNVFTILLRKMSKKGFYQTLLYISEKGEVHYNDILRYATSNKIVDSRSQVRTIVNTLTDFDLLDRTVSSQRPIRTTYKLSRKGQGILHHLKQMESEFYE